MKLKSKLSKICAGALTAGMLYSAAPKPADAGDIALEFSAGRNPSVAMTYTIPYDIFGGGIIPKKSKTLAPYTKFEILGMNPLEQSVKFRYTSNDVTEFVWGLTRILHPYNTNSDGEKEWYPFLTRPIKPGGILSPLNPYAWKENPALTAGVLVSEVGIGLALSNSGGGSSGGDSNEEPASEEEEEEEDPEDDGGGTGWDF